MSGQPPRLANEAFMPPHTNLRVYCFANTESVGLHWHEFYEMPECFSENHAHFPETQA